MIYFGIVAPGSTNDNIAFHLAEGIPKFIDTIPKSYFLVGDAAYTLSEKLLTPFSGTDRNEVEHDTFNFYLSQLRIRIEMSFGLLTNKFRILKTPLENSMKMNSKVILACSILHNFIIDNKIIQEDIETNEQPIPDEDYIDINVLENIDNHVIPSMETAPNNMSYCPTMLEEDFIQIKGFSQTRDAIVEIIDEHNIECPTGNLVRNNNAHEFNNNNNGVDEVYYHPS